MKLLILFALALLLKAMQAQTCRVSKETASCNTIMVSSAINGRSCDCYNFCGGKYEGCCGFGESCSLSCSGGESLVAGCTDEDRPPATAVPTATPTVSQPSENTVAPVIESSSSTCRVQINMASYPDLVATAFDDDNSGSIGISMENCDCANFCDGVVSSCCKLGEPCSVSCSDGAARVAGCNQKSWMWSRGRVEAWQSLGDSSTTFFYLVA